MPRSTISSPLYDDGLSVQEIATELGRSVASVSDKLQRPP